MRIRALVPALTLAAALGAPSTVLAEPDHRSRDRGRRSGYERSSRGHDGRYERGRSHRSYRGSHSGRHGRSYRRPHYRRYNHRPRPYYRPYHRRYYQPYWGPRPLPHRYYGPWGAPYAYPGPAFAPPPYRRGVHGSVSIGVPFFGFSLHF